MTIHPVLQALSWGLLHFLWQGTLLALVLFLVQSLARRARPALRYAAGCFIMLAMAVSFAVTVYQGLPQSHPANGVASATPFATNPAKSAMSLSAPAPAPLASTPSSLPDWIAGLWLLG